MPRRKCVGCGRGAPKPELIRIALTDRRSAGAGEGRARGAVLDHEATMPGRGAYLCHGGDLEQLTLPAPGCLAQALKQGAIARALRCSVTLPVELVESQRGRHSRQKADEPGRTGTSTFPISS